MTPKQKETAINRIVNSRLQALSLEDLMEMFKEAEVKILTETSDDELEKIFEDEFGYGVNE